MSSQVAVAERAPRERWSGTGDELASALSQFVVSKGWLVYSEADTVSKATTDQAQIKRQSKMLASLQDLQHNLSFSKSVVGRAFTILSEKFEWDNDLDRADWIVTMTKRLRNITRTTIQACLKRPNSDWVRELPWMASNEQIRPKSKHTTFVADMIYGYDPALKKAWCSSGPAGVKQLCTSIEVPEGAKGTDCVVGVWPGFKHTIPDMMVKDWTEQNDIGNKKKVYWEGLHTKTKHRLHVTTRADRRPIATVNEQGRQIMQVFLRYFGDEESEEAAQRGCAFAREVAMEYATGSIEKADLKAYRDKLLFAQRLIKRLPKRSGAALPKKDEAASSSEKLDIMKKPAASGSKATSAQDEDQEEAQEESEESEAPERRKAPARKEKAPARKDKAPARKDKAPAKLEPPARKEKAPAKSEPPAKRKRKAPASKKVPKKAKATEEATNEEEDEQEDAEEESEQEQDEKVTKRSNSKEQQEAKGKEQDKDEDEQGGQEDQEDQQDNSSFDSSNLRDEIDDELDGESTDDCFNAEMLMTPMPMSQDEEMNYSMASLRMF